MKIVRGIAALILLAVLLIAPPLLLLRYGRGALPTHVPSWDEVTAFLSGADFQGAIVGALVLAAWVLWAIFALSVILAVPGEISARPVIRIPGASGPQWLAGALIAAILAVFTSTLSTSPALAAPAPTTSSTAPATPTSEPDQSSAEQSAPTPDEQAQDLVITVEPGDTLWDLAEHYYGDGARYVDIQRANLDRAQPDGSTLGTASSSHITIRAGWTLQLPGITTEPAPPSPTASTQYTVEAGDSITEIAQEHYGTAAAADLILDANLGSAQPNGATFTDPDMIDVGWRLTLPAVPDTTTSTTDASTSTPTEPAPPTSSEPPATPPPSPPSTEPAPPSSGPTSTTVPTVPSVPTAVPQPQQHDTAPSPTTSTSTSAVTPERIAITGAAVGCLLASAYLVMLGRKRSRQQQRRRPGHQSRVPAMSDLELSLRTLDEPASMQLLDRGLRSVIATAAVDPAASVPPLLAAVVAATAVRVLPIAPTAPIPPFRAAADNWWELDRSSEHLLDAAAASQYAAPWPTLSTLGTTPDGALILVDLESAGALTLHGTPQLVRGVLAALALELAAAPWADDLTIHTVGFAADLAGAIAEDRIVASPDLDEVLDDLEYRQSTAAAALDQQHITDPRNARASGSSGGDAWMPEIVLTGQPITAQQRHRLAAIANDRRSPLAAVIAAAEDNDGLPGPWHIHIAEDGSAMLPPLEVAVAMQHLTEAQYATLVRDLTAASDVESIPCTDARSAVPPEPLDIPDPLHNPDLPTTVDIEQQDQATLHDLAVLPEAEDEQYEDEHTAREHDPEGSLLDPPSGPEIRVLGPVEIIGTQGPVDANKRNSLTELAAYLALFPGRSGDHVSDALGAAKPWSASTRNGNVSRLRKWFGKDEAGADHVPTMSASGYRLAESVRTDWQRFTALVEHGITECNNGDPRALEAALMLVRGAPFEGRPRKRYLWADRLDVEIRESVVDVAHTLAVHYLQNGRVDDVRRVVEHGLMVEPASDVLFRDVLRAEGSRGNTDAVIALEDRLDARNADLGLDRDVDTDQLLHELLEPQRAHG